MDNVFVNGGCGMDIWLGEGSRLGRSVWIHLTRSWKASLIAQLVKNLSARPETACNARDAGPMPRSGGSPGEGNGNLLQYSCLGNLMDRGAWQATAHGVIRTGHNLVTKPQSHEKLYKMLSVEVNPKHFLGWFSKLFRK